MKAKWIKKETPPYFIPLLQQRRMLPEIAEVANLFYDSQLDNAFTAPEQYRDYESFKHWYVKDWKYDNPIVLVDTAPLNALTVAVAGCRPGVPNAAAALGWQWILENTRAASRTSA